MSYKKSLSILCNSLNWLLTCSNESQIEPTSSLVGELGSPANESTLMDQIVSTALQCSQSTTGTGQSNADCQILAQIGPNSSKEQKVGSNFKLCKVQASIYL